MWIANENSKLVHSDDCDYADKICLGRVEFEELYHALARGYSEAGCCLTDRPYASMVRANEHRKIVRQKCIGPNGCLVCGETRCVQLAHIIPRTVGGAVKVPMCPTHHKAYDEGCLSNDELEVLSANAAARVSPKTGGAVYKMHGMVKRLRESCDA
jgi:hypothetical protein